MEKDQLIEEYYKMIEDEDNNENKVQEFLENHTAFIPMEFLLNHQLHMNCVISKFKLGNELVTDFAYLTKCSDYWNLVLVELETPKKKIFTNNKNNVYFSSEFNHAYDQITSWKSYIEKNKESVLYKIDKLKQPLNDNHVRFKYILVIGRNKEKENSEKRRAMFAEKSREDFRVMTYDSLASQYKCSHHSNDKIIVLSSWEDQGFIIKKMSNKEIDTSLFAYLKPDFLQVSKEYLDILKKDDYQMDIWEDEKLLTHNNKYDAATLAKKSRNPFVRKLLQAELKNNK